MNKENLQTAKTNKKDEFYTQYHDIEKEIMEYFIYDKDVFKGKTILLPCDDPEWSEFTKFFANNFGNFSLKKLISTSVAQCDESKTQKHGKIFILEKDNTGDGKIDINDLEWEYMEGDGDFRSEEVTQLRDEADVIITNPPFSLFREFLDWIIKGGKQFVIIGNLNAITCKDVFPLIKENKMWLGESIHSGDREFGVPDEYPLYAAGHRIDKEGKKYIRVKGVRWFTNLNHGRRHEKIGLMTMEDNKQYNKYLLNERFAYKKYDNYDAIEIPRTNAIPSDYDGIMGVPITFLDKYNPDQFEIIGMAQSQCHNEFPDTKKYDSYVQMNSDGTIKASNGSILNGNPIVKGRKEGKIYYADKKGREVISLYMRIFIKHKNKK